MTPTLPLMRRLANAIRTPRLRTMREFAEQEIVIPTGPFVGLRFSCARQPFSRLLFDAIDTGKWRRVAVTGPSQSGKTLCGFVMPILYHLFEVGETVIVGLPSMDMAGDKWAADILPAIQASRYRELLPRSGSGSRGGRSNLLSVQFTHGRTLRFMSGAGDDKSRSAYTSRVVVITEADGMDTAGETSREADPIAQLEARTQAFGDRARVYIECTVSIEEGRIWQEVTTGTHSRVAIRCPHCRLYVTPERENFTGWQGAEDELNAAAHAGIACPECAALWTEEQRVAANHDCLLVHKGQEITPEGTLTGQPPRTETLGFRWNAANNLLVKTAAIAKKEWRAARSANEDGADKELNQFWWAKPFKSTAVSLTALDPYAITKRLGEEVRGRIPATAGRVTVGIDVGKYLCHWVAIAWLPNASPHVIEYGRLEVPTAEMGEERAVLSALRKFRDEVAVQGWPAEGGIRQPAMTLVDAGWLQDIVLQFTIESPNYIASKGFGVRRLGSRKVGEKTEAGWRVKWAPSGAGYELLTHPAHTAGLLDVSADHWKTWLHARIQTPVGKPGAFTLHQGTDHLSFAKHLTAEKKIEDFEAGKGLIVRWEVVNRNNHYLDATCLACVAGHALGERLMGEVSVEPQKKQSEHEQPDRISAADFMGGRKKW